MLCGLLLAGAVGAPAQGRAAGHARAKRVAKPKRATRPLIEGAAVDGAVLNATPGTWRGTAPFTYSYQWAACVKKRRCSPIPGATQSSYRVGTPQIGKQLRLTVTARNSAGSSSNSSNDTAAVQPGEPVELEAPTISGTATEGETLTAAPGSWAGTPPLTFGYQWLRCPAGEGECNEIAGASEPTYTVAPADTGKALEVLVTASSTHGSAAATSAKLAVAAAAPANTALPSISGTAADGQTLTATPGTWSGTEPIAYAYQWQRCNGAGEACVQVAGATKPSYKLSGDDVGATLRVAVTATNSGGSGSASSPASPQVVGVSPTDTALPTINGTPEDGQLLSASPGTWVGTEPIFYAYQWQLCNSSGGECDNIFAAVLPALLLNDQDIGHTVRVVVTATNIAGTSSATSQASAPIEAIPPRDVIGPGIVGLPIVGQTLTALNGLWSGSEPLAYSYQWQRCNSAGHACAEIQGATNSTYTLTSEDASSTIEVTVTATNASGSSSASSATTLQIAGVAPTNTAPPEIGGTPEAGGLLTASPGTWVGTEPILYGYQWQLCNAGGGECNDIFAALLPGLLLGNEDIGHTLRVTVTATNIAGTTTATSPPSNVIKAIPPSNVIAPSAAGLQIVGQTLTALNGLWLGSEPITYSYQWQRCNSAGHACAEIPGATNSTYTLTNEDAGKTIEVTVTATNSGGSSSASSQGNGQVSGVTPANTAPPEISGTPEAGGLLSASPGTWSGTEPILYGYQWQLCNSSGSECNDIFAALLPGLLLGNEDIGHTLRVTVTATNIAGTTTATSPPSNVIKAVPPSNVIAPSVVGLTVSGQTLTALNGLWSGSEPLAYAYQWQLCNAGGDACEDIAGATGPSYAVPAGDIGETIRVTVTASNSGGSESASSGASAQISGVEPADTAPPTIVGEAKAGQLLAATTGDWSGSEPILYSYQWQLCNAAGGECSDIFGAILPTLLLGQEDIGHTLRVTVTATNIAGSTSVSSAATAPVTAIPPLNTVIPTMAGLALVGQTVTALDGLWVGSEPISYTYQWQRCNGLGADCGAISGATKSSYTLTGADLDHTVAVTVTATNAGGTASASSIPTLILL